MTQEIEILQFLHYNPEASRAEIGSALTNAPSPATLKRMIADGVAKGHIEVVGRGPATRYRLTPQAYVTMELNLDTYFDKDVDERQVQESFNFELINEILPKVDLFTDEELQRLDDAQQLFRQHLSEMSELEYRKEMERLRIDLSWKSSQIEGNTYSLLETERLLKEKQTASGKTKEEAVMLLNHKDALDFILDVPDYLKDLTVARIGEIHALLTKELGVERNIRHRRVGITGTNYTPLDNEFQIREALEDTCDRRHGLPFLEGLIVGRLTLGSVLEILLARFCGDKEFIEVQTEREGMVVGQREHEVRAEPEVGREEGIGGTMVVAHLCADIADIESPRPLAFVASHHRICHEIA